MSCTFCEIWSGQKPAQIYFEDDEVMVIKDINPVNEYHYLAISKEHIHSEEHLEPHHISLVKRLVKNGRRVITGMGADPNDILFGFHRDPFLTVYHLHLHLVSPRRNLQFDQHLYQPNTRYFIMARDVIKRLEEEREGQCCVIL